MNTNIGFDEELSKIKAAFLAICGMPDVPVESDRIKNSIKDVKAGSYVKLNDSVYYVEEKSEYREGQWKWYELKLISLLEGETIFLEWEQDDKLEAAIWETGLVRFNDLGLTAAALDRYDDDEEGSFIFRSEKYIYDESDAALWLQNCQGAGVQFYYYDFYQDNGSKLLSIEKWDGKLEVSLGYSIDPRKVDVLIV